ncbi:hypothetical protein ACW95P_03180, partial [Candidatus Mycoplasma pogonae]
QTLTQIGVSILIKPLQAIAPGVGIILEAGLSVANDLLWDYVFDSGSSTQDIAISIASNILPFANKVGKHVIGKYKNRFYGIASQINDLDMKAQLKKLGKEAYKIGRSNEILKYSKKFSNEIENISNARRAYFKFGQNMPKLKAENFKTTLLQNKEEIKILNSRIKQYKKVIFTTRQLISAATSPEYLAKKTSDLLTSPFKRKINKYINENFKNFKKTLAKKYKFFDKYSDDYLEKIPVKSKVISHIKFIPNNNTWDFYNVSCIVYFRKDATSSKNNPNGKPPIYLSNKSMSKIVEFINSSSPMAHYLDNFAWGWDVGKFLRENKQFMFISKIPVFGSLANTIIWSQKTVSRLITSIKNSDYEWKNKNLIGEFGKGLKDNALKGWKIPYLSPISYVARGALTNNPRYITTTAFKQTNKVLKTHKLRSKYWKRR